jgi:hydrolase, TatD family
VIDTHAHLNEQEFDGDIDEVLDRAKRTGITNIIVPGSDLETSYRSIELAERYSIISPALGIHPHDSSDSMEKLDVLSDMARGHRPAAIGEIGLDYHYDFSPREVQKAVFREQVRIAKKLDLPVIVHIRESFEDAYRIMAEERLEKGVVHCFSEGIDEMKKILSLGLLISFTGIITFKNLPAGLAEVVRYVPQDRYMIETDSPYLTPVPYRGRRNEPSYLAKVAQKVSEIREIPVDMVIEQTDTNAILLFELR